MLEFFAAVLVCSSVQFSEPHRLAPDGSVMSSAYTYAQPMCRAVMYTKHPFESRARCQEFVEESLTTISGGAVGKDDEAYALAKMASDKLANDESFKLRGSCWSWKPSVTDVQQRLIEYVAPGHHCIDGTEMERDTVLPERGGRQFHQGDTRRAQVMTNEPSCRGVNFAK